ncbi:MAG: transporter [Mycobacterium sp.]|nr:transporter [Mycobacterium sp.]
MAAHYCRAAIWTGRSLRPRWVLTAVSTALFCVQIDYFAMNLALPHMAVNLGGDAAEMQWVISVYMPALGAFMVPAGRIGDIFGRRRTLLTGIAVRRGVGAPRDCTVPGTVIGSRALQRARRRADLPGISQCADECVPAAAIKPRDRIGLWHSRIGQRSRSADRRPLDRDTRLALNLLAQRSTLRDLVDDPCRQHRRVSRQPATIVAFITSILLLTAFVAVERSVRWPLVDITLARNPSSASGSSPAPWRTSRSSCPPCICSRCAAWPRWRPAWRSSVRP